MNSNKKEKYARIEIRVKPKEKEKIKSIAAKCNLSVSEYVLQRALGYSVKAVVPDAFYVFNERLSELLNRELSPELDKYIEEYTLLCDNNIQSPKELLLFQENLSTRIAELEQERYAIRLKIRRVKTPEAEISLKELAKEITKKITPLREKLKIAQRIETHIPKIKELLDNERATEMKRNNLIKKKERGNER